MAGCSLALPTPASARPRSVRGAAILAAGAVWADDSVRTILVLRSWPAVSGSLMGEWVCPRCGRQFARARQSHECAPAMTLEDYLATGPPHERPVVEAVLASLAGVGPFHVEPVSVGIFLKNPRKFAELRPLQHWVAVAFNLGRQARHRAIVRKVIPNGSWYWHVANVARPADLDHALRDLLVEAYDLGGG